MPTDEKPSRNEDEYFGKRNLELIHEMRLKLDAEPNKPSGKRITTSVRAAVAISRRHMPRW